MDNIDNFKYVNSADDTYFYLSIDPHDTPEFTARDKSIWRGLKMVYSDVVNQGLILPRKSKYTLADYKRLRKAGHSIAVARFICICSAIFHGTDYSKTLESLSELKNQALYTQNLYTAPKRKIHSPCRQHDERKTQ